jgi:hypothetical protein
MGRIPFFCLHAAMGGTKFGLGLDIDSQNRN